MTVRRLTPILAFLVAVLLVIGACDAGRPAITPTPAPTADGASETDELPFPTFDLSSFDFGSFALPSFSTDPDLEAMLPDQLGGTAVRKQSVSGATFLATGMAGAAALEALLEDLGKSADDLSVGFGTTTAVTIIAYRIDGIPAQQLFAGFEAALAAAPSATLTDATVGGRNVKVVTSPTETTYVYLGGDAVFIIGGAVTPALLEEAVLQLPAS
jgi:hypothetical protein